MLLSKIISPLITKVVFHECTFYSKLSLKIIVTFIFTGLVGKGGLHEPYQRFLSLIES